LYHKVVLQCNQLDGGEGEAVKLWVRLDSGRLIQSCTIPSRK
jgi:hypothetical protein